MDRRDTRAGSYRRKPRTRAGEVTLKVPKLRRQAFETAIIERCRRRETSVEGWKRRFQPDRDAPAGVSVRRVEGITAALWGTRVSPGTVSRLNQKIHAQIAAWRNRPIAGTHPYVHLDGVVLKRSWAGEARNVSLLVAVGVSADGFREVDGAAIDGHLRGGQGGQGAARRRRTRPSWSPVPLLGDAVTASGVGLERHGGHPGSGKGPLPYAT